jgi:NADPH:quinone reductase-like Zn-dependent oxidoreductase
MQVRKVNIRRLCGTTSYINLTFIMHMLFSANLQNWTIHGLYWGSHKIHRPHVLEDSLNELLQWLSKGMISVSVSHSYPLSKVRPQILFLYM